MMTAASDEQPLAPALINTNTDNPDSSPLASRTDQLAEQFKSEANKLFQAGKYDQACERYSQAIALNPLVAAYWCNRAFAHIKMELFGYAIRDADEAVKQDPSYTKGYYRRATANMALNKVKDALQDYRTVVKYAPNDLDARQKYSEVLKIFKRLEFEKAMSYDAEKVSVVKSIDLSSLVVDASYEGMVWPDDSPITIEFIKDMMDRFKNQKLIHSKYAYRILLGVKETFDPSPPLVDIPIPSGASDAMMTVCGDVHGQFYDLLNIFAMNGLPSDTHGYLFNGDFVDRGSFSAEVILTLFAFKLRYPSTFFMSRGNHETDDMNRVYGFEGEIKSKFSEKMFKLFSEIFCAIPLANVIAKRIFVVHGGLFSRDDVTLSEIRKVNRFMQPPHGGLMSEMLWADPQPEPGRSPSKRGVGLQFGPDVTANFLKLNNLDMVFRSHEVKDAGYLIEHNGKLVTVFSAPNYCDSVGNKGAYINLKRKDLNDTSDRPELDYQYTSFTAVPHPPVKPMHFAGSYGGMFGL